MPLVIRNGKILTSGGKLVTNNTCCCEGDCSDCSTCDTPICPAVTGFGTLYGDCDFSFLDGIRVPLSTVNPGDCDWYGTYTSRTADPPCTIPDVIIIDVQILCSNGYFMLRWSYRALPFNIGYDSEWLPGVDGCPPTDFGTMTKYIIAGTDPGWTLTFIP